MLLQKTLALALLLSATTSSLASECSTRVASAVDKTGASVTSREEFSIDLVHEQVASISVSCQNFSMIFAAYEAFPKRSFFEFVGSFASAFSNVPQQEVIEAGRRCHHRAADLREPAIAGRSTTAIKEITRNALVDCGVAYSNDGGYTIMSIVPKLPKSRTEVRQRSE